MLEHYLRPLYQSITVDPFANYFAKFISPNRITFIACLLGIAVFPALRFGMDYLAMVLVLLSGYLDTLDGSVARLNASHTALGTVLDILSDRIVETAIIFGLYAVDPAGRGALTLLMLGSCYICVTSFLVVGIFVQNESDKGFYYSPGLIERAEAFLFFLAMILLPQHFQMLSIIFSTLVLLTSVIRVKQFMSLV